MLTLLFACVFLIGIITGLFMAVPGIKQRVLEVETYWRNQYDVLNKSWNDFHSRQTDKWLQETKDLIHKTYHETIEERDRAWEKKLNGKKLKSKLPSN